MFRVVLYKTSVGGEVPRRGTEKRRNRGGMEAREVASWNKEYHGGTRKQKKGKAGERSEEKEREREREREKDGATHCKLNLKAGQMGAVMVARAPLFHPS